MASHQGWLAKLVTGEWVYETTHSQNGEPSPWQQLIMRCQADNTPIVQLKLLRSGACVVALPRCTGYFHAYEIRRSNEGGRDEIVQGIGSVVKDDVFICWVDEHGLVSQEIRPLKEVWVHTTNRVFGDLLTPRV